MTTPKYTEVICNIIGSGISLFDFVYPIYDPLHKAELENKIIRHYYFHEIGSETVGRFKYNLNTLMNEIMPKYNKLYEYLALNTINPLGNIHITETTNISDAIVVTEDNSLTNNLTRTNNLTSESDSTVATDGNNALDITVIKKFSDTPNGQELVLDNGYLTNVTEDVTDNNEVSSSDEVSNVITTNTGTVADTGSVTEAKAKQEDNTQLKTVVQSGSQGLTAGQQIEEFIKSYNDVDVMIINELSPLFMRVY